MSITPRDVAFAKALDDPTVGVVADFTSGSDTVLLAFGGLAMRMGVPPFEFFSLTQDLPVSRLFVRDAAGAWYQHGVHDYGDSIDELAVGLQSAVDRAGASRLVVAGNSAGGYAALLFGTLLNADVVLACSPQTSLDRRELAEIGGQRWADWRDGLDASGGPNPRYARLRTVLPELANGHTAYQVHYSECVAADEWHARNLADVPGLELVPHPHPGHDVIKMLRGTGRLSELLIAAITA